MSDLDTTRVGQVAAELMEGLADSWSDHEGPIRIGEVLILVELQAEDDEGQWTDVAFRCSDPRRWVQRGLMHAALHSDAVADLGPEDDDG